jgi:hypothetical protein
MSEQEDPHRTNPLCRMRTVPPGLRTFVRRSLLNVGQIGKAPPYRRISAMQEPAASRQCIETICDSWQTASIESRLKADTTKI